MIEEIVLAEPRGFCAGVERAIAIVEESLKKFGSPIYVRHEIVHNKHVVEDLKSQGAIFVDSIEEIPEGANVIFSAHGVSEKVEDEAKFRNLQIIDATCPLVTKVHIEAKKNEEEGRELILIGHAGHPEVEGTSGRVKQQVHLIETIADVEKLEVRNPDVLSYVTQTTLSVDDTKAIIEALSYKFPKITGPNVKDICYATQNRQNAVKEMSNLCDIILVIGASNSSNSNRLRDLGNEKGVTSYLIRDHLDIDLSWFTDKHRIGITAGASAPEKLVQGVANFLQNQFNCPINTLAGIKENVKFKLPKILTISS